MTVKLTSRCSEPAPAVVGVAGQRLDPAGPATERRCFIPLDMDESTAHDSAKAILRQLPLSEAERRLAIDAGRALYREAIDQHAKASKLLGRPLNRLAIAAMLSYALSVAKDMEE